MWLLAVACEMKTPEEQMHRPSRTTQRFATSVSKTPEIPIATAAVSAARWPNRSIWRVQIGVTIMPTRYTQKTEPSAALLSRNGGPARWNVPYVNIATIEKNTQKP